MQMGRGESAHSAQQVSMLLTRIIKEAALPVGFIWGQDDQEEEEIVGMAR